MLSINDRFKDAPWYKGCIDEDITVVGVGGIGSNALYYLTKTIPANYSILDPDIVEEYNIGSQFFNMKDIKKYKVSAIYEMISGYFTNRNKLHIYNSKFKREFYSPIMISALDNMKTRKEIYDVWKTDKNREILIDGRLRANMYEVFVVTKGKEEEYEKTLFDDSEVDGGPCTFKQTAYFGGLIGARITHVLVNYLTNKYSEEPVATLPFKITEVGEPFYIEIL